MHPVRTSRHKLPRRSGRARGLARPDGARDAVHLGRPFADHGQRIGRERFGQRLGEFGPADHRHRVGRNQFRGVGGRCTTRSRSTSTAESTPPHGFRHNRANAVRMVSIVMALTGMPDRSSPRNRYGDAGAGGVPSRRTRQSYPSAGRPPAVGSEFLKALTRELRYQFERIQAQCCEFGSRTGRCV